MEQQEKLLGDGELFAVVEVMGHNTFAGRVREQVIGGSAFIRVDVKYERLAIEAPDDDDEEDEDEE